MGLFYAHFFLQRIRKALQSAVPALTLFLSILLPMYLLKNPLPRAYEQDDRRAVVSPFAERPRKKESPYYARQHGDDGGIGEALLNDFDFGASGKGVR